MNENEKTPLCRVYVGHGAEEKINALKAQCQNGCEVFDRHMPPAPKDLIAGGSDMTLARFRAFCAKLVREGADRPILICALLEFVDESRVGELLALIEQLCRLAKKAVVIADPCRCVLRWHWEGFLHVYEEFGV